MNPQQEKKLEELLKKRKDKLDSLQNFNEYFDSFSRIKLKKVIEEINERLINTTNERLRVFYDNPYENHNMRHYVMVQLIPERTIHSFILNNLRQYPSMTFIGNEISGEITVDMKFYSGKSNRVLDVKKAHETAIVDLIISFLSNVY